MGQPNVINGCQRRAPGVATAAARPEKGNGDLNSKSTHQEEKQHHCRRKELCASVEVREVRLVVETWRGLWTGLWTEPKFVVQSWNVFYSRFPIPCLNWCSADWGAAHCMRLVSREGAWSPGTIAPLSRRLGVFAGRCQRAGHDPTSPCSKYDLQHCIKAIKGPKLMQLPTTTQKQRLFEAMGTLI